jgi:hypothetical protein
LFSSDKQIALLQISKKFKAISFSFLSMLLEDKFTEFIRNFFSKNNRERRKHDFENVNQKLFLLGVTLNRKSLKA